ncbi:MAG TPA: shikimate dehydrogenase [Amnibacterium sp.]|uniref:shikimate dehydrogenase family protein n=1 Tax=Amnibacterium sp. TaxID=1872496 RepID=UPI002F947467
MDGTRRLAVLGAPIAHSRSPLLHAAAARVLGLDWDYGRAEVREGDLAGFLAGLGPEWLGLSLTMPLKRAVVPFVADHDALVERLGLANTLLLGERPRLFNTDVAGVAAVLGAGPYRRAVVLGAGATAASSLEALRRLGVPGRIVAARDPARAEAALGGLATGFVPLSDAPLASADVVVATLPGGTDSGVAVPGDASGVPLLDVAYDPWPSALGAAWAAAGGVLLHGLDLLIEQALLQVRIFTSRDPERPLSQEDAVREAMRAAVGRDVMEDS